MRPVVLGAIAVALLQPAAAQIRISCIGDSITAGVCAQKTGGYPKVLQTLLGSGYTVTNYGNSGKTMLKKGLCGDTGGDCSYWDTPTWPAALASKPDIVTIMLGTNDAKQFNYFNESVNPTGPDGKNAYETAFLDMITQLLALPTKPKVYVVTPPPLYPPFPYEMNKTVINEWYPVLLRQIAAESGAVPTVIDVFAALGGANLTQPGITCDGCHPVDKGYDEAAATIAAVLQGAIQEDYERKPIGGKYQKMTNQI